VFCIVITLCPSHLLFSIIFLTLDQIELNLIEMLLERFSTLCVIFVLHCIWKFCKATWSNYAFWLANISTIFPELLLVLYMTIFLLLLCINWLSEIPDDHHYKTSLTYENKADLIIISLKINLFSPWYSWKIAELALNNNHSLTHMLNLSCSGGHLGFQIVN
jgi:hypothetical protein